MTTHDLTLAEQKPLKSAAKLLRFSLPLRTQTWAVTLVFVAMTIVMTWPQALLLATHAQGHHDVYFNMWRLAWVAHALTTAPARLFDGNIFYPEARAMTYSDAMIVEGLFGTLPLMMGLPPVLVHNLLLLGAIVTSATGIFVLARHLTGSAAAGVAAGVIFAFVPYRFEHYMHMELQWTMWIPWAFWALHRTVETHVWRYGLLTGLFMTLQLLSSIYYGVFLIVLLGVVAFVLFLSMPRARLLATLIALAPGAIVVAVLSSAYGAPYLVTKRHVGGRAEKEIITYSARPSSYLVATPENILYGKAFASRGRPERRLFPGCLAVVLGIVGVFARPRPVVVISYLLAMVAAYEMSLGLWGYSYRFLFEYVWIFQGFRAIARLGIFVVFFLAILAAYGYAAIAAELGVAGRRVLFAVVIAVLLLEYRVRPLSLVPFPNEAPPLYAWLAKQPPGVVAELPMPDEIPGTDPRTSYLSTFHWQPIVNGYSGFSPQSYLDRFDALQNFPDERSMMRLRRDNVRYLVVHLARFPADEAPLVLDALRTHYRLPELGRFSDGHAEAAVFLLR